MIKVFHGEITDVLPSHFLSRSPRQPRTPHPLPPPGRHELSPGPDPLRPFGSTRSTTNLLPRASSARGISSNSGKDGSLRRSQTQKAFQHRRQCSGTVDALGSLRPSYGVAILHETLSISEVRASAPAPALNHTPHADTNSHRRKRKSGTAMCTPPLV